MGPTNTIGYLLQHLAFVVGRQSDVVLQERLGIGLAQFKILMVLKWNPLVQQREIAERLGQTEASISRQIKLLHDQGLLQTRIRQENRRQHITVLTTKGEKLIDRALAALNAYHAPMFDQLSDHQRQELLQILGLMHRYTCEDNKPGACRSVNHPFNSLNM